VNELIKEGESGGHIARGHRQEDLKTPSNLGLMVPAAVVDDNIADLSPSSRGGDILIDGGQLLLRRRSAGVQSNSPPKRPTYVDVEPVGGSLGSGERLLHDDWWRGPRSSQRLDPIFAALRSGKLAIFRAPLAGRRSTVRAEQGYLPLRAQTAAGHFVKMVHNGIEYGVMGGIRGGESLFCVKANARQTGQAKPADAETGGHLRDPEHYQYDINLRDIAEVWRRGSVIASWLLDLTAAGAPSGPESFNICRPRLADSGEGRWTIKAAIDEAVTGPQFSRRRFMSDFKFSGRRRTLPTSSCPAMRYEEFWWDIWRSSDGQIQSRLRRRISCELSALSTNHRSVSRGSAFAVILYGPKGDSRQGEGRSTSLWKLSRALTLRMYGETLRDPPLLMSW